MYKIGLNQTGHMSFLTGLDRTEIFYLTLQVINSHMIRSLDTNLVSKVLNRDVKKAKKKS